MTSSLSFLFLLATGQVCDASCLAKYLDEPTVVQLAEARDLPALEHSYASAPVRDSVVEIFHCTRLLELKPGRDADECLLGTMPRSAITLWYFYSLTFTKAYNDSAAVVRVVNDYYGNLARAVLRRKKGMREFLLLKRFSDGEVAEELRDWDEYLCEQSPGRFVEALRTLDPESQRRVCGDCKILRGAGEQPCDLGE